MNRIIIDGSLIDSRQTFFDELRRQIGDDRMYGSNLDALHDTLTSITVHTVLEIRSSHLLETVLGDYWKRLLWMLNDCMDENKDLRLEIKE